MEELRIENFSFTYNGRKAPALNGISLRVRRGEFVTLCGFSGSGKSTLLRCLKPTVVPAGSSEGGIFIFGGKLADLGEREQAAEIGFVTQSPEAQPVSDMVRRELAFGLESLGLDAGEIRVRVAETAAFFGIEPLFERRVGELSGGQKQLLNLAAVMAMRPRLLLLDEPVAQLDPIAAREFLSALSTVNRELGTTVIISEQRLEETFPLSDRAAVLQNGKLAYFGTPREVGLRLCSDGQAMADAMPAPVRIYSAVTEKHRDTNAQSRCPMTVREGRLWLEEAAREYGVFPERIPEKFEAPCGRNGDEAAVELKELWFRYKREEPNVLRGLSLNVRSGELFALLGGNGEGKSTALSLICGDIKAYRGKVRLLGREVGEIPERELFGGLLGMLEQDPRTAFTESTVRGELFGGRTGESESAMRAVKICGLEELLDFHPYDLSGGEQQRLALAKLLTVRPRVLLLDEPTKGLDAAFKRRLAGILHGLCGDGVTVIMASHDVEFCALYASRCALLFGGRIVNIGAPRSFFSGNSFYTTAASRMARSILPMAVTVEDVISALGKEPPDCGGENAGGVATEKSDEKRACPEVPAKKEEGPISSEKADGKTASARTEGNRRHSGLFACLAFLVAAPVTVVGGAALFGGRNYYFVSLLIIIETVLAFFSAFEMRKPKAGELVVLAVLCSAGVAGRAAFAAVPGFKPVLAVVIIAGVCFGGETGFFVGAVTALVSNIFFGQGPWTPWQMFAFGVTGFIAGLIFHRAGMKKNRLTLCVYGGFSALLICGPILDTSSAFMFIDSLNFEILLSYYAAGFPLNLTLAAATVFFLFLVSGSMLEKLERIKLKYGLME